MIFRKATIDDWDYILNLRNNVKEFFFYQKEITKKEHYAYMREKKPSILIAYTDDKKIGYVRYYNSELSVVLEKKYRGMGYGKKALSEAVKIFPKPLTAIIRTDNPASQATYRKCGFVEVERNEMMVRMEISLVGSSRQGHLAPSINVEGSLPPTYLSKEQLERFWNKVLFTSDCWLWQAGKTDGYGRFNNNYAHRIVYKLYKGEIPKDLEVDHLCRNRLCVNPTHLEAVSHKDNILRGIGISAIHARKTHCPQGHEYSGKNLYIKPNGSRNCRECHKIKERVRRKNE